MLSNSKHSRSSVARMASRPPGTQHNEAHSMILAMCMAGPIGKPVIAGSAAKIAVSQARPAMTTSTPSANARWNAVMPIWPTMFAAASISSSFSAGMSSIGVTPFVFSAALRTFLLISARSTAMRNLCPPSRAISRTSASVLSRCGLAPADPADPITSGILCLSAPSSTFFKSRFVEAGAVAISPLPR
jgi:hypothetical protein